MTFLSPYVLPVAQVVWGVEIHSIPHVIWKSISWHLIQFWSAKKTDRWLPSPIYFYLFLLVIYFLIFQLPYQQLPLELADKVIEKIKKKYIEWHFCHHMYFPSLKLFEVLKFIQFLMLFENQFLDTSSNFGAPKKQIDDCLHRSIFIYFAGYLFFDFSITLSATSFGAGW